MPRHQDDDYGPDDIVAPEGAGSRHGEPAGPSVSEILDRMRAERDGLDPAERARGHEPAELDEDAEIDDYRPRESLPAAPAAADVPEPDSERQRNPFADSDHEYDGTEHAAQRDVAATEHAVDRDDAGIDLLDDDEPAAHESEGDHPVAAAARGRELQPDTTWRKALRGVGQTLISLGVVVLLFIVYEAFITDIFTAQKQSQLSEQLHKEWDDPKTPPTQETNFADVPVGDGFAVMRIPAFGADYAQVVVQGTTNEALEKGPGHYQDTVGPGEVGNFAIAGHRVGKGSPFLNLDKLKPGDAIVFETQANWYVYRVIGDKASGSFTDPAYGDIKGQFITTPSHYEVIAPVPGKDGEQPTQRLLTLTTCHPKFSAAERMIIHAYLDGEPLSKSQYAKPGDIPALKEG